ncbi:MAG: SIR2 family protein [Bacillota bacterium]
MSRVFVLGSGFSAPGGAPLTRNVLPRIFDGDNKDPQIQELQAWLANTLFPKKPDWLTSVSFEEILSRLDLIKYYRPYPDIDYKELEYYEELLLAGFTGLLPAEKNNANLQLYQRFLDFLESGDTIVSFNYDLVLETALKQQNIDPDYMMPVECTPAYCDLNDKNPKLPVLKLHGSINLYFCPDCKRTYFFSHSFTQHPLPGEQRPVCTSCRDGSGVRPRLKHLVIAPTLFKSYSLPFIRRLWFLALDQLAKAGEIFFIGYSLPEEDILAYQLFDFAWQMAAPKPKLTVVDGPRARLAGFRQIYGKALNNTGLYLEDWVLKRLRWRNAPS